MISPPWYRVTLLFLLATIVPKQFALSEPQCERNISLDVYYLQDATYSFRSSTGIMRQTIKSILDGIQNTYEDTNIALGLFLDSQRPPNAQSDSYCYKHLYNFSRNTSGIIEYMTKTYKPRAADTMPPEDSLSAMAAAISAPQFGWRRYGKDPLSGRFVVPVMLVVTDALFQYTEPEIPNFTNITAAIYPPFPATDRPFKPNYECSVDDYVTVEQAKQIFKEQKVLPVIVSTAETLQAWRYFFDYISVPAVVVELAPRSANVASAIKTAMDYIPCAAVSVTSTTTKTLSNPAPRTATVATQPVPPITARTLQRMPQLTSLISGFNRTLVSATIPVLNVASGNSTTTPSVPRNIGTIKLTNQPTVVPSVVPGSIPSPATNAVSAIASTSPTPAPHKSDAPSTTVTTATNVTSTVVSSQSTSVSSIKPKTKAVLLTLAKLSGASTLPNAVLNATTATFNALTSTASTLVHSITSSTPRGATTVVSNPTFTVLSTVPTNRATLTTIPSTTTLNTASTKLTSPTPATVALTASTGLHQIVPIYPRTPDPATAGTGMKRSVLTGAPPAPETTSTLPTTLSYAASTTTSSYRTAKRRSVPTTMLRRFSGVFNTTTSNVPTVPLSRTSFVTATAQTAASSSGSTDASSRPTAVNDTTTSTLLTPARNTITLTAAITVSNQAITLMPTLSPKVLVTAFTSGAGSTRFSTPFGNIPSPVSKTSVITETRKKKEETTEIRSKLIKVSSTSTKPTTSDNTNTSTTSAGKSATVAPTIALATTGVILVSGVAYASFQGSSVSLPEIDALGTENDIFDSVIDEREQQTVVTASDYN